MEVGKLTVESFGSDCLGNPTGYKLVNPDGTTFADSDRLYVADLYDPNKSHAKMRRRAEVDAEVINATRRFVASGAAKRRFEEDVKVAAMEKKNYREE